MLETSSLRFEEKNTHKGCKIAGQNKVFFSSANLGLRNHYSLREGLKKPEESVIFSALGCGGVVGAAVRGHTP